MFKDLSDKALFFSGYICSLFRNLGRSGFVFQGKHYQYFIHLYTETWRNERIVEIPIMWKIVNDYKTKKIFEVGNVLSHYFPVSYDILDKYEKAEGVINQDVVDYKTDKKYDLIVSISTLEHVGFGPQDGNEPGKLLRAIDNLKKCLSDNGRIAVTLPLGHNPELDKFLAEKKLGFTEQYFLKRVSQNNDWIETSWDDVKNSKYGKPFPCANAIVVGIIEK